MARELPLNQIRPAAQPVDAFVRPATPNTAAPAGPQLMPNPSGIRIVEQGSGGSVQGYNQYAQLAEALAPFSKALVSVASSGLQLYASNEYEKGQSEAMKAQVLANQQMLQSMGEYASENRSLAQVDPIGALMMDRVNPYREAGRVNALSRVAAKEINSAVLAEYSRTPGVEEWKFDDPRLKQLQARAVASVTEKYRLDPGTPGFIDYVLPEIGQATDKLVAQHREDRTNYLKNTVPRLAAVEALGVYESARKAGVVEWSEFDPVSGREIRRTAQIGEPEAFEYGVRMRFAQILDAMANESGLPGMASQFKEKVIEQLGGMATAAGKGDLYRIVAGTEVGPIGKDGRRPLAAEMFGLELLEVRSKYGQMVWQEQQRTQQQGLQSFQAELATITFNMADGPERGAAIMQLVERYERQGLNRFELLKAAEEASVVGDRIAARSYSTAPIEQFFLDVGERAGSGWNVTAADAEYRQLRETLPPQERGKYDRQWASIREGKEKEKNDVPGYLVDPLISGAIKARLREFYPSDTTEAALRGANITDMLAFGDANVARSAQLQLSAYRKHVYARLQEAKARKGGELDAAEVTSVTQAALAEYGKNDERSFNQLFPGSPKSNTPGVGPARPPAPGNTPIQPPPGRQAASQPVYPSSQLDNIPNRAQRLKGNEPVMELPSAQEEATRILNGRAPSAAVSRAAKDAGLTPGAFVLRQLEAYPSFRLPPDARQQLLRSSRGAQGITDASRSASSGPPRPVQMAAMWFFDALTGARPSMAGTLPALQGGGRNGGGPFMDSNVAAVGPININGLRRAIVGKESGGNFSAVNPDSGALGYGQVMPANVPSWTKEHYGRSLTPKEFLANREAQMAVVNGQIAKIVRQQLAAGYKGGIAIRRAASIWYSGRGDLYDDNRPQFDKGRRYPSIREYTLDILRRYTQGG